MTSVAFADELLLLAYDDETGRCTTSQIALDLGMAAAVLVDLALHGRIEVINRNIVPVDPRPTGHPVADRILTRMAGEEPHSVASWLQRMRHGLREHLLAGLVSQGIIRDQDETAWEFIHLHRYPMVDPTVEQDTRSRLAAALTGDAVPDERTAALAALVAAVHMEPTLGLTGEGVAEAHKRLEEIAGGAGFAAGTVMEESTVRPSIAFVIGELSRAVRQALGPAKG